MKIDLPILVTASDYHEFTSIKDNLNLVIKSDGKEAIGYKELGCTGDYVAVFFDKKNKPSNKEILTLVLKDEFEFRSKEDVKAHLENLEALKISDVELDDVIVGIEKERNKSFFAVKKAKLRK